MRRGYRVLFVLPIADQSADLNFSINGFRIGEVNWVRHELGLLTLGLFRLIFLHTLA